MAFILEAHRGRTPQQWGNQHLVWWGLRWCETGVCGIVLVIWGRVSLFIWAVHIEFRDLPHWIGWLVNPPNYTFWNLYQKEYPYTILKWKKSAKKWLPVQLTEVFLKEMASLRPEGNSTVQIKNTEEQEGWRSMLACDIFFEKSIFKCEFGKFMESWLHGSWPVTNNIEVSLLSLKNVLLLSATVGSTQHISTVICHWIIR